MGLDRATIEFWKLVFLFPPIITPLTITMGQSTIIFCVLGHFRHGNTQPNDNQQGDPSARLLLTIFEGSLLQQVYFSSSSPLCLCFFLFFFHFCVLHCRQEDVPRAGGIENSPNILIHTSWRYWWMTDKPKIINDYDKVNRCLARYSPRATTTNRPTNRAAKKPAWPGPNWPKMTILGQIWSFMGKKSFFLLEKSKVLLPT